MDRNKMKEKKKVSRAKIILVNNILVRVNSVPWTDCNKMRGEIIKLNEIKKFLCKIVHTLEQFYSFSFF